MLFQGTSTLDQLTLNRRAADLGGEHNADTGYEDVSLLFEVFNEDVGEALGLLAEQYYDTHIDPKALAKERRVVMEEIRGRLDDPAERLYRRAWSRLFGGALGSPVSGTVSSVRGIEVAEVESFRAKHFTHANSVLSIVGGVPIDELRRHVRRTFTRGHAGRESAAPADLFPARRPVSDEDLGTRSGLRHAADLDGAGAASHPRHRGGPRHDRHRSRQPAVSGAA